MRTITRLFPAEMDLTFRTWRRRARILVSFEVLDSGRVTVAKVAARPGFAGAASFGQAFRLIPGVSPGLFSGREP